MEGASAGSDIRSLTVPRESLMSAWGLGAKGLATDHYTLTEEGELAIKTPSGAEVSVSSLIAKYGTPLEVMMPWLVTQRVQGLYRAFEEASKKHGYSGNFALFYPMKTNPTKPFVTAAMKGGAKLEVGSHNELVTVRDNLYQPHLIPSSFPVICNGFKDDLFLHEITDMRAAGYNVMPIIESRDEFRALLKVVKMQDTEIPIGVRARVSSNDGSVHWAADSPDNRFGMGLETLTGIAKQVEENSDLLKLRMLHYHPGSDKRSMEVLLQCEANALRIFERLWNIRPELDWLDCGGGFTYQYNKREDPLYSIDGEGGLVDTLIKHTKTWVEEGCESDGIPEPHLAVESGRWLTSPAQLTAFSVIGRKPVNAESILPAQRGLIPGFFYIAKESVITDVPDVLLVNQHFQVIPARVSTGPGELPKVWLAGATCDSDDVMPKPPLGTKESRGRKYYTITEEDAKRFPRLPNLKDFTLPLPVVILDTGAYQDALSGFRGGHHNMFPDAAKVLIAENGEDELWYAKQTPEEVYRLFGWTENQSGGKNGSGPRKA